jgi:hypothetical protein
MGLARPRTQGLAVTNWMNNPDPKLDGRRLPVKPLETSCALSISEDRGSFLLGTIWHLLLLNSKGKLLWTVETPGSACAVNLSRDGKLAVAALGDGTIRWYRAEDGKELLAFFPHADRKRWVAWTPAGYYDASPGGEDLIGWHINNGKDSSADFYPASRFRADYYRPGVFATVFSAHQTEAGNQVASSRQESVGQQPQEPLVRRLPPVVTIVSPDEGGIAATSKVIVRYRVRTPSGEPVTNVRALVDGRPMGTPRKLMLQGVGSTDGDSEIEVTIPERDCEVAVIAENRYATSEPARIRLRWQGQAHFEIRPKLYVLAVGVSSYPPPHGLGYPAKDAKDFVEVLERQRGRLYRDIEVRVMTDAKATHDSIVEGLDWIEKNTTQHDVAMVFLSGHGVNDPRTGIYYYLPADFDVERLRRTAVGLPDFLTTVKSIPGKTVVFLDTCYSGNVLGGRKGLGATDINGVINEMTSAENGAVVFAASSGNQVALERPEWGNGAFTKALVEGLNGAAAIQGNRITLKMLDLYISERVKELTGGLQTPVTRSPYEMPDYPLALR